MLFGGSATLRRTRSCTSSASSAKTNGTSPRWVFPSIQNRNFIISDFNPFARMAGDIQESTPRRSTDSKTQRADSPAGNMPPTAPSNANALPGGGQNTAGSKNQEASLLDAAKSIRLSEFKEVHKKPCVRDALMTGIGTGFGIGGVRSILGGKCSYYHAVDKTCLRNLSFRHGLVQLGCWLVLLRFLPDVRVLPAQASFGVAWDEASR